MALGTPVIGTAAYGAGSTLNVGYPASVGANDQLVLICVQRPASVGGGTFTPPAGWTTFASYIDKGGYGSTAASDTGNMNIFIATKDALAAGGETGTVTVSLGGNGVTGCAMVRVPTGGGRLTFDVTGGEKTNTSGSVSVAGANNPGIKAGDVLLWAMAIPTDVTTPAQFSAHSVTASGATIGSATELVEFDTTTGNDLGGYAAWAACTAGASSGVPTIAATAGGTTTNVRGPLALLVMREGGTVLDRFNKSQYVSVSGGDLTVASNDIQIGAACRVRSTTTRNTRRYLEATIGVTNAEPRFVGVCNATLSMSGFGFSDADLTTYRDDFGVYYSGGSYAGASTPAIAGDIVSMDMDPTQGVRWRVNGGTWSAWAALPSGTDFYALGMVTPLSGGPTSLRFNFGQADGSGFAYTAPAGALGWDQTAPAGTPVGRADETDTAYALPRVQQRAVGLATETDTAYALSRQERRAVGLATETDTAYALSRTQTRAYGRADEVDTAYALSQGSTSLPVGLATEIDTAYALSHTQRRAVSRSDEVDTAYALARVQNRPMGLATETDVAFALAHYRSRPYGRADETDTAYALVNTQARAVGRANETDTAYALTSSQRRAVGRADEVDTAFALLAGGTSLPFGLAVETDTAYALVSVQRRAVGLAVETDEALSPARVQSRPMGRADEVDTALTLTAILTRPVGVSVETDTALGLVSYQRRSYGRADEVDTALQLFTARIVVPDSRSIAESRYSYSLAEPRSSSSLREPRVTVSIAENRRTGDG